MESTKTRGFLGYLKDYLARVTGISTAFFGVSWQPPPAERETLRRFIIALGDRRILYHDGCGIARRNMIDSCSKIRDAVSVALEDLPESSKAMPYLEDIRAACHQFQTYIERHFDSSGYGNPEESFYMAIGELRGSIGRALADICTHYGIADDALKNIEASQGKLRHDADVQPNTQA